MSLKNYIMMTSLPMIFLAVSLLVLPSTYAKAAPHGEIQASQATREIVTGRTVDTTGRPVPGLTVTLEATHGDVKNPPPSSQTTDANGRFELPFPSDTCCRTMTITGPDKHLYFCIKIPQHEYKMMKDVVISRGLPLSGILRNTDGKGGGSIGVIAELISVKKGRAIEAGSTVSFSDGSFEFEDLSPGTYKVRIDSQEYVAKDVETEIFNKTGFVGIVLYKSASVIGKVLDSNGKPVKGVTVKVGFIYGDDIPEAISGDDGAYRIEGILPGKQDLFTKDGGDYAISSGKNISIRCVEGEVTAQDIQVVRCGSILLTLRSSEASPAKEIEAYLNPIGLSCHARMIKGAVKDGKALLKNIAPGEYELFIGSWRSDQKLKVVVKSGVQAAYTITMPGADSGDSIWYAVAVFLMIVSPLGIFVCILLGRRHHHLNLPA